jgi:hypothetical protein
MCLPIALDLRDFIQRLPALATARIVGGQRSAGEGHIVEHPSVGEIAIVRNGQRAPAGRLLIILQIGPKLSPDQTIHWQKAAALVRLSPPRRGTSTTRCKLLRPGADVYS